jgi:hypothetical protein
VTGTRHVDSQSRSPEMALRALGVRCTVEALGNLAIVIPAPGERTLEDEGVRGKVLAALRAHGFTHAAVEPCDDAGPATTAGAPHA